MLTLLIRGLTGSPILRYIVLLQIGMAMLSVLGVFFDHRQLLGLNVWVKPLKFDISIAVMLLTAGVFLESLEGCNSARLWSGGSLALALGIEGLLISLQAARGVRSHLNVSTTFDAHVSMVMGIMAVVASLAMFAMLALTFVAESRWPPAVLWGMRLGLLMFLAGSIEGTLMFRHGGHTIGGADGGPGVPWLNWSRQHGDLRIAHFFALHALQVFPIFGYLSSRTAWSANVQIAVVLLLSASYTAGVWFLFKVAMHGRPLALPT